MLHDKIQHKGKGRVENTAQGEAESCICHKIPQQVLYFIAQHEYMVAFTDLSVLHGRIRRTIIMRSVKTYDALGG